MRYLYLTPTEKPSCARYGGRFAAYIVQEVGEKRVFLGYGCEENSLTPYAAQNELAATISRITFQTSKR